MPKERRRSLREAAVSRASPLGDGGGAGKERRFSTDQQQQQEEHQSSMEEEEQQELQRSSEHSGPGRGGPVPQVTITAAAADGLAELEENMDEVNGPLRRKLSNSSISSNGSSAAMEESEDDILSDNETKSKGIVTLEHLGDSGEAKAWWKLKTVVHWPLVASHRKRLSWVQLAGHKGSFKAAEEGTILKKYSENEKRCFESLRDDALQRFVPAYHGVVERDGDLFLQMNDLLVNFDGPNVMDCKMGVRTYQEEELERAREKPKLRRDLYNKMLEVDSEAPTAEEQKQQAITKPRYMQWRESLSSTNTLGFRIEGVKKADGTCHTDFKKTRSREDVTQVFRDFVSENGNIISSYIRRLEEIRQALKASEFFMKHEVIGSSLLFIHNQAERAEVWLIDFGKTTPLPDGQTVDHWSPWQEGNREDGYLWGLENLLHTLTSLNTECSPQRVHTQRSL
ncbi:inositol-trisphosphate 3-kinase A [Astyanax mexicanus]|uniref:inositol-trisphosphate 3-kinase A n=1 Tax=Astyanax mexicanus TaxID=7994 RepID=UPI0020CAF534|nr:inositol-trisphosphate 3-kinase A [Astyanax mexicanus]XP_022528267.2 inositol-trisphosphate 3-kinase A [Astyanax mexicanus]XP_049319402.1 inositol-trisphosphate 3-kinase A [Astyanax mexicanus]XP_049319404.1 inositol-trisphosphate 3-kinase A [Astyanax mexicanus]